MHSCILQALKYAIILQGRSGSWKILQNGRNRLMPLNQFPLFGDQINFKSTCSDIIGETDLLLEDGMDIQELPVIVRKVTEAHMPESFKTLKKKLHGPQKNVNKTSSQDREVKEMIEGFDKCYSQRSVFTLLELIPQEEIVPSVALQALKTIIKFENSQEFKSKFDIAVEDEESENFTKNTVLNNLIDILITSEDNTEILEALQLISEEMSVESAFFLRQKLCDEVLIRIADDKFNIFEICSSARSLLISGNQVDIDKLWVGVVERQNDINEDNIMEVFRLLLHVNLSRSLLLKILQKQLEMVALKLQDDSIAEILTILNEIKEFPFCIIQCLSNWLSIKVLNVDEEKLGAIIEGFMLLPALDDDVVKALERFMKVKKFKISNPELVGIIMDYCNNYKIRSPIIFKSCTEYLVHNAKSLPPSVLKSIFLPFGNLNYCPSNKNFWRVLEEELLDKFVQLYSEDALDIMLSFIFLEKHPIKFVTKIFNPYFLDRLHSLKDPHWIHIVRTKLKLLDTALTLECKLYEGPLLLPDMSSTLIKQDPRIQKMSDSLIEILPVVLGPDKSLASSVVLKNLPLTELYIVDIIAHPKGKPSLLYSTPTWNDFTALLIHLPEHYDSSGRHLIGLQVMRKRHLRRIGLNVVDLDYNKVNSMLTQEDKLKEYLQKQLSLAEEAFPS